jgi:hypothetical protein
MMNIRAPGTSHRPGSETGIAVQAAVPRGRLFKIVRVLVLEAFCAVILASCGGGGGGGGKSTPSNPAPAAPTGIVVVAGNSQLDIGWNEVAGATSYNIYRSTSAGSRGAKVGACSSTTYTDTTVANGTTYYYTVTADNSAGEGPPSSQSDGATPAAPVVIPTAPTGVNATAGNAQVVVTWTTVSAATSYNIYRSTSARCAGNESWIERYRVLHRHDGCERHHVLL